MGCAKLMLELIAKERSCNTTFQKIKKGLKKKTYEFSTLCDVDACLIIFGPKQGNRLIEPKTWPENREDVLNIIEWFRKNCTATEGRGNRHIDIPEFYEDQIKKLRRELTELKQQNSKTQYPTWDNRLDNLFVDQLKHLAASLDSKIEFLKTMIDLNKGYHYVLDDVARLIEYFVPPMNQNPAPSLPLPILAYRDSYNRSTMDDMHMHLNPHHQPYCALDQSLVINGMECMGNYYGTSNSIIPYHPTAVVSPMSNQICYNPIPTVVEMTVINNAEGGSVRPCYFSHPYFAPPLHQINEFFDLHDYHHDLDDKRS
ncbi:MADS-box transcription factor PHERES 2-like [Telopea speciosissima]|uniref:MADS-box transcription factor PHERES 2-like n=1 Tax=Telopea speciosissima TaxID=54955 RepID=UPI001CC4B083|nr:MADS-box transcription factor PHERES 2-like [Telopea speciosissima]